MPTFTAIALDSLLEQGSRNPNPKPPPAPARVQRQLSAPPNPVSEKKTIPSRPSHAVSPTLYTTPEVTPLPDSPSSFPPSPYIINHKRRGPRLLKSFSQSDVLGDESKATNLERKVEAPTVSSGDGGESKIGNLEVVMGNGEHVNLENGVNGGEKEQMSLVVEVERDAELDEFVDFLDSMSTSSNAEMDEGSLGERSWKPGTPVGEYYDAFEEISSDGTRSSCRNVIEDELREMRLNLLMEIEKRKQAEEALENLQSQWQNLRQHLSLVGLTLPTLPAITDETVEQPNLDPAEGLCQQIVIARTVASSIGRACSRAEVEMEVEPQIEAKNFEIARLSDRLQYYEAANREMSQRNQEAMEMARQQRHRRKRRQRWILGSIGVAVTLGAAAIAWSYTPASKPSPHEGESHGD
ncbi:uncharacterized protein LOC109845581 [Asparagus officinalis]|uniref:uncharacterized protein LOC109845581 n=1 Tax=Asparagus officinalis TaxID=4686 RepID=UPI00098E08B2|nr:uncharacterized protein LOC109845581 [Asparagus officinalis]